MSCSVNECDSRAVTRACAIAECRRSVLHHINYLRFGSVLETAWPLAVCRVKSISSHDLPYSAVSGALEEEGWKGRPPHPKQSSCSDPSHLHRPDMSQYRTVKSSHRYGHRRLGSHGNFLVPLTRKMASPSCVPAAQKRGVDGGIV